jgi:hypothetical protein
MSHITCTPIFIQVENVRDELQEQLTKLEKGEVCVLWAPHLLLSFAFFIGIICGQCFQAHYLIHFSAFDPFTSAELSFLYKIKMFL